MAKGRTKDRFFSVRFFDRITSHIASTVELELSKMGYPELRASHFEIITYLLRKKEKTNMTALSIAIERKKSTITVLIQKLESLGLVYRELSASDKREWDVSLTAQAKGQKKSFFAISSKLLSLETWGITNVEEKQLYSILEQIYSKIKHGSFK